MVTTTSIDHGRIDRTSWQGSLRPDGSEGTSVARDLVALRLAGACGFEADIRRRLCAGPVGDATVLENVLTAARGGGDLTGPLETLHAVLQAIGDPDGLDRYTGPSGVGDRGVHAAGVDRGTPNGTVWLCPTRTCLRFTWPSGAAQAPRCAVTGADLLSSEL
jgi:hypothetical protein